MPCICNTICSASNCPANVACYGNQPACPGNVYDFTVNPINSITVGVLIEAQHIDDLETSINNERTHITRRGPVVVMCPPDTASQACAANCSDLYTFTGTRGVGDDIAAGHFDNVRDSNDLTDFATVFPDGTFNIGNIVTAVKVLSLQTTINQTRDNCICDSHISCSPDCCNVDCPGDDATYPPI